MKRLILLFLLAVGVLGGMSINEKSEPVETVEAKMEVKEEITNETKKFTTISKSEQDAYYATLVSDLKAAGIASENQPNETKEKVSAALNKLYVEEMEKQEKERAEAKRIEAERLEQEKLAQEEAERIANEKAAREAAEKAEREALEQKAREEQAAKEKAEREAKEAAQREAEAKKNEISWSKVDDTYYATRGLNVRKGPGTQYDRLGSLEYAEAVKRLAVGSNGWVKIEYKDSEAYVAGNYLSKSKPSKQENSTKVETKPAETKKFDGSTPSADIQNRISSHNQLVGVMYVPSVGMSPVDIYAVGSNGDLQSIADMSNGAYAFACYSWDQTNIHRVEIGDHNHQNFKVNKNIKVGTVGYINMGNKVLTMECISAHYQEDIATYDASIVNDNGIIATTTCAPGGTRTVNRWVVSGSSDVSFDDLWNSAARYYKGQRDCPY